VLSCTPGHQLVAPWRKLMPMVALALLGLCGVSSSAAAATSPPTLRDHPIESGLPPLYLDGAWSATSSAAPATPALNATVPGDILTDLQRAGRVPDPYFNSTWSEPSFVAAWNTGLWTYSKSFTSPPAAGAALLVFEGIRMGAMISLNGHQLGNASDQFLRYTFPVGPLLKPAGQPNQLSVVFGAELGIDCQGRWTRSNQIDWAPRMPTSDPFQKRSTFGFGIW
jgi:beta-mannosidase